MVESLTTSTAVTSSVECRRRLLRQCTSLSSCRIPVNSKVLCPLRETSFEPVRAAIQSCQAWQFTHCSFGSFPRFGRLVVPPAYCGDWQPWRSSGGGKGQLLRSFLLIITSRNNSVFSHGDGGLSHSGRVASSVSVLVLRLDFDISINQLDNRRPCV